MKRTAILALSASVLALSVAHAEETDTSKVGKVTVTGVGNSEGSGYILREDATKSRSTVTKEGIENRPGSANPYQHIDVLPGVNALSQDGTGLFGGAITMRGFNSQQLGFTIDGAPVNDSGNFEVYPQEYTDSENLEQIFVTQGSTDPDSPHVGASGGNIGIVSSNPVDYSRIRISQAFGEDAYSRSFIRFDTGNYDGFKAYVSYSNAQADKFKGEGEADRDHMDAKLLYQTGNGSQYSMGVVWNNAVNNFFRRETLADIAALGYDFDYASTIARSTPNGLTVQNESQCPDVGDTACNALNSNISPRAYYGLQVNPFENAISTMKANMQLTDNLRLDVEPYFWYGNGGGAFGVTVSEGNPRNVNSTLTSSTLDGACDDTSGSQPFASVDLNGDGDTRDCVLMYRNSLTETYRPGVNTKLTYNWDNYKFTFGGWYERARHYQSQPFTFVDDNGLPLDVWSKTNNALVTVIESGEQVVLQGRKQSTISEGWEVFGNLQGTYFDDALKVNIGLRAPTLDRTFDYIDLGSSTNLTGLVQERFTGKYDEILPSAGVSFSLTPEHTFFADAAKNMKAPPNFILENLTVDVRQETSWNYEVGYRFQGERIVGSLVAYKTDFEDRLMTSYNSLTNSNTTINIGPVEVRGVEAEIGTAPWHGLTAYLSASYTDSEVLENMQVRTGVCSDAAPIPPALPTCNTTTNTVLFLPTAGKQMVDTPEFMLAASFGWESDGFFLGLTPKYRGKQWSTLVNDEAVEGFTIVDATAGYRFGELSFLKNAKLQLSVSNLFNKNYLFSQNSTGFNAGYVDPVGGAVVDCSATTTDFAGCVRGSSPSYYVGGERFVSLAFTFDVY